MVIDLRSELKELLEVEMGGVGRWVVVRHFTGEYDTRYWKPETHEAVGGPAYKYTDYIVLSYSTPAAPAGAGGRNVAAAGLVIQEPVEIESSVYKFYLMHDVQVNENDEIFELNYNDKLKPTIIVGDTEEDLALGYVKPKERYKVRKTEVYRCDNGRIEYQVAYGDRTFYR